MAGVIIDGQVVPTKVVYVGNLFNIWKFEIPEVSYSILLNQGKQLEISVTSPDSENLAADLEMLKNILENKLFFKPFYSKEKPFKIYCLKGYRQSISKFFYYHTNLVIKFTRPLQYPDYSIDSKCIFMNMWTYYPYILILSTKNIQKEFIVLYLFPHHLPKYFLEKLTL